MGVVLPSRSKLYSLPSRIHLLQSNVRSSDERECVPPLTLQKRLAGVRKTLDVTSHNNRKILLVKALGAHLLIILLENVSIQTFRIVVNMENPDLYSTFRFFQWCRSAVPKQGAAELQRFYVNFAMALWLLQENKIKTKCYLEVAPRSNICIFIN